MTYYLGEQLNTPPDPENDRRKYKRRYIQFAVRYRFNAEGVISDWKMSQAGNMSAGGLFMTFGDSLQVGQELDLEFSIPGRPKTIKAVGTIRWLKMVIEGTMVECGLEFSNISREDRALLDAFAKEEDASPSEGGGATEKTEG